MPGALSGSREAFILNDNDPVHIIGERINPTGKKKLQEELRAGRLGMVERLAREQKAGGAVLLDVNAGVPGVDEAVLLRRMVSLLSLKSPLPLVLDSADTETIIRGLRLYPGRALVNSISADGEKLNTLLPAAAFYGAMLIILPVTGRSLPRTAGERVAIAGKIIATAAEAGYQRRDLVVDGLTMPLSSRPLSARETLATIARCRDELKVKTVIGLSNISFGLPKRCLINTAFLAQAAAAGLTFAIADPDEKGLMETKLAADLLRGADDNAARYTAFYNALTETDRD
jgi:5-methyltetrahydrofolate--homocysteine methyltransferase